jgi:hypothetical protein
MITHFINSTLFFSKPNKLSGSVSVISGGNNITNRGNYRCGRCGQPKVNHVCEFTDTTMVSVYTQAVSPILADHHSMRPHANDKILTVSSRKTIQDNTRPGATSFDYQAHSLRFNAHHTTVLCEEVGSNKQQQRQSLSQNG